MEYVGHLVNIMMCSSPAFSRKKKVYWQKMCQEKDSQLTRGNEFGIGHIGPRSILTDLAILIEIMIISTLLGKVR